MRKTLQLTTIFSLITFVLVFLKFGFLKDSDHLTSFRRVQVGMSVDEVQAILGPGTQVAQVEVPTNVIPVNLQDAIDSADRARKSNRSPPTFRDYPTRLKPVVEGDYILRWVDSRTGERILVAFKEGMVCEKQFYDPNYL